MTTPYTSARALALLLVAAAFACIAACSDSGSSAGPGVIPPIDDHDSGGDDNDTGGPGTPGKNCTIPSGGQCDGTIWRYCNQNDTESAVDCAEVFENGKCRKTAVIAQCVIPIGGECITVDVDGTNRFSSCAGTRPGCVTDTLGGTLFCEDEIGTCDAQSAGTCLNGKKHLVTGCLNGQPRVLDCEAMGGQCGGRACEKLPEGAECQTETAGARKTLICATGLVCHNPNPLESLGVCTPR